MTIEAIKRQIEPAINSLFENIIKAQQTYQIDKNAIPVGLSWDFGANEKFEDLDKIKLLRSIQGVASIPQSTKMKVILPILNKIIDEPFAEQNKQQLDSILQEIKSEQDDLSIKFGEV